MGLNLTRNYSYNFDASKRSKKLIRFIIIHYTGMKIESEAIERLCNHKTKVSSHYFIKNSGEVINLIPDNYQAWHAGKSKWKNFDSLNKFSIGIEINNQGHRFGYKSFYPKQINSLKKLLKYLIKKYKIKLENILGHSDIAPNRKKDPGENFPWEILSKNNLCKWHDLNRNRIKEFRKVKISDKNKIEFLTNLSKIGYSIKKTLKQNKDNKYVILAFQRRFRQDLVNGKIDQECFLISKSLIK